MKRHASHRSYIESTGTGVLVDSEALLTTHSHAAILGMWGCLPTLNFFNSNFMEAWFCFFCECVFVCVVFVALNKLLQERFCVCVAVS